MDATWSELTIANIDPSASTTSGQVANRSSTIMAIIEPAPVPTGSGLDTFLTMTSPPRPLKSYKTYDQQIALLSSRGMIIGDHQFATKWLQEAGYYRLSLYTHHFRETNSRGKKVNRFRNGTTFEDVVSLYIFDRELRYRVFSGIEKIEVALRARMAYHLGFYGPDVHKDASHFRSKPDYSILLKTFDNRFKRALTRNDEVAVHHKKNYGGELPIWVLTDLLDFSDLSKLFAQLRSVDQRAIAKGFGLNDPPKKRGGRATNLAGWLHQLSLVRNFTAHHARLWDRQFGAKDVSDAERVNGYFEGFGKTPQSTDIYGVLTIMSFLLESIEGHIDWAKDMAEFLTSSSECLPSKSLADMGFPSNWNRLHPWSPSRAR
ncbi:abortive infection bacteriophage resistance protein [Corynebacterium testudinoris]|uniref:Abortive infection bacteriophage resistance protein n=2 Tax=Corynebacterium testudinoris TaxID=136857 RepID=A0A0G3H283_9CORY|nr:abortive infection bacteriophage resistance protein [Corynebacterium testudinoris]